MCGKVLCLYGAGGHGRVIARQAVMAGWPEIVFADASVPIGTMVGGSTVRFSRMADIKAEDVLICIGDNVIRERRQAEARAQGLRVGTLLVEAERYFGATLGVGCVVLAGAVINDNAQIGEGVIVNTAAIVEHDAIVADFAHVAPGAVIGGGSRLGRGSLLGSNATIVPGIAVGDMVTVGAGAVVVEDILEPGVYVGVPARRIGAQTQVPSS